MPLKPTEAIADTQIGILRNDLIALPKSYATAMGSFGELVKLTCDRAQEYYQSGGVLRVFEPYKNDLVVWRLPDPEKNKPIEWEALLVIAGASRNSGEIREQVAISPSGDAYRLFEGTGSSSSTFMEWASIPAKPGGLRYPLLPKVEEGLDSDLFEIERSTLKNGWMCHYVTLDQDIVSGLIFEPRENLKLSQISLECKEFKGKLKLVEFLTGILQRQLWDVTTFPNREVMPVRLLLPNRPPQPTDTSSHRAVLL